MKKKKKILNEIIKLLIKYMNDVMIVLMNEKKYMKEND